MKATPTPEQLAALAEFAAANGRSWKSKLNHAWMTGRYSDYAGTGRANLLQQLRNNFGPSWLARFSLGKRNAGPGSVRKHKKKLKASGGNVAGFLRGMKGYRAKYGNKRRKGGAKKANPLLFPAKSAKRVIFQVGSRDFGTLAAASKVAKEYALETPSGRTVEVRKVTTWFDGRHQYPQNREVIAKAYKGKLGAANPSHRKTKKDLRKRFKLPKAKLTGYKPTMKGMLAQRRASKAQRRQARAGRPIQLASSTNPLNPLEALPLNKTVDTTLNKIPVRIRRTKREIIIKPR